MRLAEQLILVLIFLVFHCSAGLVYSIADEVMPLKIHDGSGYDDPLVKEVCSRIYSAAQKQARFLLSRVHPWNENDSMSLLTESKSREHWIRPNTGTVAGLMFLHRFGPYDEAIVGVSKKELLENDIIPMVRYLIATHQSGSLSTGDGKPWGDAWQSAHWAHMIARGSWWIWDTLPQDVQEGVRRITAHEAERFVNAKPPAQIENDTKAEENAWNSQILSTAVLLMPDDPRRPSWERAFQRWAISSFLRPDDEFSKEEADGHSIASQFIGANIYNDFTLENHGIVHPDYMTTFTLLLGNQLDFIMTGRPAPESLTYNVQGVYENLKWFSLEDGGFVYPSGQDWRLFRNPDWLNAHLMMAAYLYDPDAWTLALRCLNTLELMQARSPDGAIYQPDEFFFASTQSDRLYSLAQSWLILRQTETIPNRFQNKQGVLRLDSGKIILNRSKHAIHTVSWGKQIMAQCLPNQLDRIVSPHLRSGVGHIKLHNDQKELPLFLHRIAVHDQNDRFNVEMEVDHGKETIRAYLRFQSTPDGVWHWQEKLVALQDVTTSEIATGFIGILNNRQWIYERGERTITIDNSKETIIHALSGTSLRSKQTRQLNIDGIVEIVGKDNLQIQYLGARQAERARITDRLYLNYSDRSKTWEAGDVISQFSVTIQFVGNNQPIQ